MVHCAPTTEEATEVAKESFEWYPSYGGGLIASVAEWMEERDRTELDTYQYTADMLARKREGVMSHITIDYLRDSGSAVMGDPDECIESAKQYEAVGCDLLLCLVNPLQDPAREGHAVDRAHGQVRPPRVQVAPPASNLRQQTSYSTRQLTQVRWV